jgi:NADH-quinone oxidoreductase subunit J
LRDRKDTKSMDPAEQVKVKRADRIRMVSMPAFKEPPADDAASADAATTDKDKS